MQWKLKEIKFLKENIHLEDKALAEVMGRTATGVASARRKYVGKKTIKGVKRGRYIKRQGGAPYIKQQKLKDRLNCAWFIRVDNKEQRLNRVVYERCFGAIPKGYEVRFKNNDTLDCSPRNLEIVSPKDALLRNQNHRKSQLSRTGKPHPRKTFSQAMQEHNRWMKNDREGIHTIHDKRKINYDALKV